MTDYVAPPKRKKDSDNENKDYVVAPKTDDYVAPPKRDDYVAPPKKGQSNSSDYVDPTSNEWRKNIVFQTKPSSEYPKEEPKLDPQVIPYTGNDGYFETPKQDLSFYITGYLVISLFNYITSFNELGLWGKIFWPIYVLLSNYTYSWYIDYRRFKGGILGWFFTPYGGIRAGYAASEIMDYSTGKVKRGLFGGYKMKMKKDIGSHLLSFLIITFIVEIIKYFVAIPVAFISLFFHKSTVRKYVRASEEAVRG